MLSSIFVGMLGLSPTSTAMDRSDFVYIAALLVFVWGMPNVQQWMGHFRTALNFHAQPHWTERLLPVVAKMRAPVMQAGNGDVAGLVAGFVHGIGTVVAEHPWLPTLWVREILCEGGALREMMIRQVGPLLPTMMASRFAAAQQAGQLNPDLDPRLLMVSLIGLTMFPLASAPIWRQLFGADDIDFNDLRRHTLVLLDRGLELDHAK